LRSVVSKKLGERQGAMRDEEKWVVPPLEPAAPEGSASWTEYWTAHGFPWRKEPEIDPARQRELARRRAVPLERLPEVEPGCGPFQGIELSRADLEWLLATRAADRHAELRCADVREVDLRGLDFSGLDLSGVDFARAQLSGCALRGVLFWRAQLVEADLRGADLTGARLIEADCTSADLRGPYCAAPTSTAPIWKTRPCAEPIFAMLAW